MKNLSTESKKKYYFVKDGTIFNITSTYYGADSCVVLAGGDATVKTPRISATTSDGKLTVYYLENLIEDGDKFVSNKFTKTIHSANQNEGTQVFDLYYKGLCEEQIKETILVYNTKPYSWFDENKKVLGIPLFMLKTTMEKDGVVYTTVGSDTSSGLQINFTEDYFNNIKEAAIRDAIIDCANDTANSYGYKVSDLTFNITKKTE